MANPFLSEIRIVGFNFAPQGWTFSNGQLLPISQNTALFSILGTTYGGNGTSNFALPNMQCRFPMHAGQGAGLSSRILGQYGGVEYVPQQTTPIPGSPQSPVTATVGYVPQAQTVSPFLILNFVLALQGIFPSRN
jgi:microcystin-dependent protein